MSTGFLEGGEVRINGKVVYQPFAKQVAYHNSKAPYPLYGGSRGCGKSKALRWDHYLPSLAVPGMKSLIVRRKLVDLQRSHLRFVPAEAQLLGATWKPSDVGAGVLYFPNGSLIEFGHCQHETDVDQYLSAEYDRQSFDEIVTFTEFQYLSISSCCRTTIPGLTPRVGGATNPAGGAARWVKRRWIDKDVTEDEDPDYRPEDYEYIPALPSDNPFLDWKQYMKMLNRLPPELRRAYRDGDWDIFLGQFFPEFRRLVHVQEFEPAPASFPRVGGLDWGYNSPGVYLWACFHPDGFLDIEDEFVFNGPTRTRLIAREVAEEITRRTKARGLTIRRTYADPSMDEQRGHESAETYFDTFRKHGVPCERADNDRVNGWARVRAWLRNRPDGQPFLRVHPRCAYTIRTFGEVTMDEQKPEDIDTDTEDHAMDVVRYIATSRQAPPEAQVEMAYPPGTVGHMRQSLSHDVTRRVLGTGNVRLRKFAY
jgi:phage terminase large subunit